MKLIRTLFLFLAVTSLALAATTTGSIGGKVSGIPAAKAAPGAFPPPPTPAVVYAVPIQHRAPGAPAGKYVVNQKWTEFQPSIVAAPTGATITFTNEDTVNHNIELYTPAGKLIKDLGTHPPGQSVAYRPSESGAIHLKCKLHTGMSGWVYMAPTPYVTTTKSNGDYVLNNIPAGQYRVVVWHPDAVQQEAVVTVAGAAKLNITLKKK